MEELNNKYLNFIKFLEDVGLNENEYVNQLKMYEGSLFILGFKKRLKELNLFDLDESEAIEKIFEEILKKSDVQIEFEENDINKFKRYIHYFFLICKNVI